jgi:hypothetical protein
MAGKKKIGRLESALANEAGHRSVTVDGNIADIVQFIAKDWQDWAMYGNQTMLDTVTTFKTDDKWFFKHCRAWKKTLPMMQVLYKWDMEKFT